MHNIEGNVNIAANNQSEAEKIYMFLNADFATVEWAGVWSELGSEAVSLISTIYA